MFDPTELPQIGRWRQRFANLTAQTIALGLVLVLILLAGFAIWGAVTTQNAAIRATHATEISELYQQANAAVAAEESLERKYRLEPAPEVLARHHAAADSLVKALGMVAAQEQANTFVGPVLALHRQYLDATTRMFAAVDAKDPVRVLAIDHDDVDPTFDTIAAQVAQASETHQAQAAQAMRDLTATETLVFWATPIVFIVGLLLLAFFGSMLRSLQRRLELANQREIDREIEHIRMNAERDAALAANRAKSAFLANMSHELRTPLTAILGYSELLALLVTQRGYHELIGDITQIGASGEHLLALINDVLDLSKIEAGKMEVLIEEIQIRDIVEDIVSVAQPLMVKNGNRLTLTLADNVKSMHTDVTKLRQVLLNLLSNAAKFTQDGAIVLRVEPAQRADGTWICFTISDTGIGVSAEQLTRLFQPFTQADASTTRRYGGTGLGLALCLRLCTLLGGQIAVESTPGVGSTFTVILPAFLTDQPTPPAAEDRDVFERDHINPVATLRVEDSRTREMSILSRLRRA